jgi:hypothetical protein
VDKKSDSSSSTRVGSRKTKSKQSEERRLAQVENVAKRLSESEVVFFSHIHVFNN